MVQGYGDSYTDRCIISAYTGLPTVFGWQTHEWLWRYGSIVDKETAKTVEDPEDLVLHKLIYPRQGDIDTIYESEDPELIRSVINKYDIRYIVLGGLEFSQFDGDNTDLFYDMFGEPVFTCEDLLIFKVTPQQTE
jgi:uncharacterized membrane protein